LLIGKDTGPRLPTLLLALGQDKIRSLLAPG
jgi:lysyl-tRNA synthetase class 1